MRAAPTNWSGAVGGSTRALCRTSIGPSPQFRASHPSYFFLHLLLMDWVEVQVDKMGGETGPSTEKQGPSYPILSKGPVGQVIEHIYRDRLGQFKDQGQYKEQSLAGYAM
jgi:hypothetical protein